MNAVDLDLGSVRDALYLIFLWLLGWRAQIQRPKIHLHVLAGSFAMLSWERKWTSWKTAW